MKRSKTRGVCEKPPSREIYTPEATVTLRYIRSLRSADSTTGTASSRIDTMAFVPGSCFALLQQGCRALNGIGDDEFSCLREGQSSSYYSRSCYPTYSNTFRLPKLDTSFFFESILLSPSSGVKKSAQHGENQCRKRTSSSSDEDEDEPRKHRLPQRW